MKKLLSLSLMLSLGLATISPALNAAQMPEMQSNPSGWYAAKKRFQLGINALTPQEKKAYDALKKKVGISALVAGVVALLGGGAAAIAAAHRRRNASIPQQVRVTVESAPLPTTPESEVISPGDWITVYNEDNSIRGYLHVTQASRDDVQGTTYDVQGIRRWDDETFLFADMPKYDKHNVKPF